MKVKICGITSYEDGIYALEQGADMLGFNFYPRSPRAVTPSACLQIVERLRLAMGAEAKRIRLVGIFVNADPLQTLVTLDGCGLDLAQCSGDEAPEALSILKDRGYKAFRAVSPQKLVEDTARYPQRRCEPGFLVDAYQPGLYGGSGQTLDWQSLSKLSLKPTFILAGGLTSQNVAQAIQTVKPWGVDVASGVEEYPGKKDPAKVRTFIQTAHRCIEENEEWNYRRERLQNLDRMAASSSPRR